MESGVKHPEERRRWSQSRRRSHASKGGRDWSWPRLAPAILICLAASVGCGRKIGDDCKTSADCDPNGGRVCDIAQPGGYCIIEGCDGRSCPDDSVCMRFFPEMYPAGDRACDPNTPDSCNADEVCIVSDKGIGNCARREWEKRVCMQSCGDNGDCRGGYECRMSGVGGALPLTTDPNARPRFCAPAPAPAPK